MPMDIEDAAKLAIVLLRNRKDSQNALNLVARDVKALRRLSSRAMTCAIRQCNVPNYPYEKVRAKIADDLGTLLAKYRVTGAHVGGDPRGHSCISIRFEDESTNGTVGEGWHV